jgi:D-alanyl-lipoteichoic acid acyltransferase DltB (MBOAT superfamily)
MIFNSVTFLVFYVFVFFVSRWIRSWRWRKAFLLVFSYIFYAAWNPPFIALLWLSTGGDWFAARMIDAAKTPRRRRLFLIVSLMLNLGMLSYFKYGGFLLENFVEMTRLLGFAYHPALPSIVLPVGISFYTFQTLSYTIDVYRGDAKPADSFLDYALYVAFFPQLVSGPIMRSTDFLPQCREPKAGNPRQIWWGLTLFVIGLFFKVTVADLFCAPVVKKIFESPVAPNLVSAWCGALAFSLQIFSDFFGYSTCAVGVALTLGFWLSDNFHFPYAALGFRDFWRRWHISLSTWLRDYLYIPLGGSRGGTTRTCVTLMATMLLGGLWHGASWRFVVWGGLHGLYLVAERLIVKTPVAAWAIWRARLGRLAITLGTFMTVCLTFVFFRAGDMRVAMRVVAGMAGLGPRGLAGHLVDRQVSAGILLLTCLMLALHRWHRDRSLEETLGATPWWAQSAVVACLACLIVISCTGNEYVFIYFQF